MTKVYKSSAECKLEITALIQLELNMNDVSLAARPVRVYIVGNQLISLFPQFGELEKQHKKSLFTTKNQPNDVEWSIKRNFHWLSAMRKCLA